MIYLEIIKLNSLIRMGASNMLHNIKFLFECLFFLTSLIWISNAMIFKSDTTIATTSLLFLIAIILVVLPDNPKSTAMQFIHISLCILSLFIIFPSLYNVKKMESKDSIFIY
jgi:hypothetical protein